MRAILGLYWGYVGVIVQVLGKTCLAMMRMILAARFAAVVFLCQQQILGSCLNSP